MTKFDFVPAKIANFMHILRPYTAIRTKKAVSSLAGSLLSLAAVSRLG